MAMRVYSDNALRTSKRGVNISNATRLRFVGRSKVLCSVATFWRHLCVIKVDILGGVPK